MRFRKGARLDTSQVEDYRGQRTGIPGGMPVTLGYVDRTTMTTGLGPTFELTGDVSADMDRIRAFYADKSGLRPALRTEPRLRSEDAPDSLPTD